MKKHHPARKTALIKNAFSQWGGVFACHYDFARTNPITIAGEMAGSERRVKVIFVPPDVHAFFSALQKKQLQNLRFPQIF